MKTKNLLEVMDTGEHPNFTHPGIRSKIEKGTHPYAKNPAFPGKLDPVTGKMVSHAEVVASDQYKTIYGKVKNYLGKAPTQRDLMGIQMGAAQAANKIFQLEAAHHEELEQAAIDLAVSLPEFEQAKAAYMDGQLKIEAKIKLKVSVKAPTQAPPENNPELEIPQVSQELDAEKNKRRFLNLLIQGAGINKNYAFHLADEFLNGIDPNLTKLYGKVMSAADFGYWVFPEEMHSGMQANAAGEIEGAAGKMGLQFKNGEVVIVAEAVCFPVLVQEIVKGLMEYITYDADEDPELRKQVHDQTDTIGNEGWDIKLGPPVWRQLLASVGYDNQKWIPQVYQHLSQLSPDKFSKVMQSILNGSPDGKKYLRDLLAEIKEENGHKEESSGAAGILDKLVG
jgi:hypothetical protein